MVISKEVKNKELAFGVLLDFGVLATTKVVVLFLIFSLILINVLFSDDLPCYCHEL